MEMRFTQFWQIFDATIYFANELTEEGKKKNKRKEEHSNISDDKLNDILEKNRRVFSASQKREKKVKRINKLT